MKRFALLAAASTLGLSVAHAGDITGFVSEATGTVPLEGAIVTIEGTSRSTATGRDGTFRFTDLGAGDYTLVVSYIGAGSATATVSLDSDSDLADLNITLGENVSVTDSIIVTGQRGSLNAALNQERASNNLIEVLSADAIASLPDENAAEALRRSVGANVLNDQGEGRFVSIRGLDPSLTSITVNGVRSPSPEGDSRAVPLDTVDADVIERLVVTKALTPDLDGDAIAGNVEIKTLSGLDRTDMLLTLNLGGVYTDQTEEFGERLSAAYADNFMDGRLGLAGSVSWQSREFGSENKEVDGTWNFDDAPVPFAEQFELRDYVITRERLSVTGQIDYEFTDNQRTTLSGFFNDFSDQEFRSRVETTFEDGSSSGVDGDTQFFEGIEVDRDIKDRLEVQQLLAVSLAHEWQAPFGQLDGVVSYSKAEEEEPDRYDADFRAEGIDGVGLNTSNLLLPSLAFADDASRAEYFDPENYEFNGLEITNGITEDEEFAFAGNLRVDVYEDWFEGSFKTGVKVRLRESTRDVDLPIYEADDLTLTQFGTMVDYQIDQIGITPSAPLFRSFFAENRDLFELEEDDTLIESTAADFEAEEDIYAAYAMATKEMGPLTLVGGIRVEHTEFEGTGRFIDEEDLASIANVSAEDSYTDVLGSLNARFEISEDFIARGAFYQSVIRPGFTDFTPSVLVDDDNEAEIGNPNLERQKANNFDVSIEIYPSESAVVSFGLFYKEIDNFIAQAIVDGDEYAELAGATFLDTFGREFDEAEVAINLEEAEILGVEFNYQQALTFLPAPFDGALVGFNYTGVDGDAQLSNGRKVALPRQSANVYNAVIGYDKGRFDLRAALAYRDEYIDELGTYDTEIGGEDVFADRIVAEHMQIDIDAKVQITDQFQVFAGFKNVNDEPFLAIARIQGDEYLGQFEEYGWATRFGLRYTH